MLLLPVYMLGAVAIIVALVYGIAISRMMSVRIRRSPALRSIDPQAIPPAQRALLERHGEALEELGFEAFGAMQEDYFVEGVDEPSWSLLYRDAEGAAVARLTLAESPTRIQPVDLELHSFIVDGRMLETVAWRSHRLAPGLPDHVLVDAHTLSCEEQWEHHRGALAGPEPIDALPLPDSDGFVARLRAFRDGARRFELSERRFLERSDGTIRFSFAWAVASVLRANRGESARLRALAEVEKQELGASSGLGDERSPAHEGQAAADLKADDADESAWDLTADLAAHRRREAVEQSRHSSWPKKLAFFAVSVALFCLAFGWILPPRFLLLVLLALFIHESGHALVMIWLGYRDMQILFIPLLGAVVSGKKRDVAPWQEVTMLLAGPVPGIALGTLILTMGWGGEGSLIREGAMVMLFINYLNLLPIVPLDGGRVMSIVFLDRFPRAQLAFAGMSSLAIIVAGISMGDVIVGCFGMALLSGVPRQLTQLRTIAKVREELGANGIEAIGDRCVSDAMGSVYSELRSTKFDRWNSEAKYQFVRQVLERLDRRVGGLRVAVASLTAYCAVFLLPVGVISYTRVPLSSETQHAIEVEPGAEPGAEVDGSSSQLEEAAVTVGAVVDDPDAAHLRRYSPALLSGE